MAVRHLKDGSKGAGKGGRRARTVAQPKRNLKRGPARKGPKKPPKR